MVDGKWSLYAPVQPESTACAACAGNLTVFIRPAESDNRLTDGGFIVVIAVPQQQPLQQRFQNQTIWSRYDFTPTYDKCPHSYVFDVSFPTRDCRIRFLHLSWDICVHLLCFNAHPWGFVIHIPHHDGFQLLLLHFISRGLRGLYLPGCMHTHTVTLPPGRPIDVISLSARTSARSPASCQDLHNQATRIQCSISPSKRKEWKRITGEWRWTASRDGNTATGTVLHPHLIPDRYGHTHELYWK